MISTVARHGPAPPVFTAILAALFIASRNDSTRTNKQRPAEVSDDQGGGALLFRGMVGLVVTSGVEPVLGSVSTGLPQLLG